MFHKSGATRAAGVRLVLFLVVAGASACAGRTPPQVRPVTPPPSQSFSTLEVIGELKAFAEELGGHPTENFLRFSDRYSADERCYLTGKLQLPEFYSGLRMIREDEEHCAARAAEDDVFFYSVEAVASGQETITVSL